MLRKLVFSSDIVLTIFPIQSQTIMKLQINCGWCTMGVKIYRFFLSSVTLSEMMRRETIWRYIKKLPRKVTGQKLSNAHTNQTGFLIHYQASCVRQTFAWLGPRELRVFAHSCGAILCNLATYRHHIKRCKGTMRISPRTYKNFVLRHWDMRRPLLQCLPFLVYVGV